MAKKVTFKDLVIWEDKDYWVINKPPHISTLADRNDLVNILALAREEDEAAQVCHRLDKDTSGALIIARNPEAYKHMSMQFEHRQVTKIYHAVADGIHDFDAFEADQNILKLANGTVKTDRKGKEAMTYFTTLKAYKLHTLIECRPVTGRMHQIRVHLARHGAPITGDVLYGGKPFYLSQVKRKYNIKRDTEEQPLIRRHALHAFKLAFKDLSDNIVEVEANYPKDFQVLVQQLDKNS